MNEQHPPFGDEELHRWVDGRLAADRAAEIEAAMRADPALARTLRAWRDQRDALRGLGREWLDETVPASMRDRIDAAARRGAAERQGSAAGGPFRLAARSDPVSRGDTAGPGEVTRWRLAASVALFAGALAGFAAGRASAPERGVVETASASAPPGFVRAAAVAHAVYVPEVRHPVEVAAGERAHLAAWLSRRLEAPLRVPDLAAEGFELVGGRLLPGEDGPSALLMYQDAQGTRVTLYVARGDSGEHPTAFRFERSGGVQSFYWIDAGLGYALSGEMPRDRLSSLATAVHRALETSTAAPRRSGGDQPR